MDNKYCKLTINKKAMELLSAMVNEGLPDTKIQEKLLEECKYKWNINTIRRQRRKITKEKNKYNSQAGDTPTFSVPLPGLSEFEKANWFREQFKKSHLYVMLKLQFTKDEVATYLEEYGNLCCQFEDIVFSEFFQIDDFLKHRILINRQLTIMRNLEEEVAKLTEWMIKNPSKEDATKDEKSFRLEQYKSLDNKRSDLNKANERYDKLISERQKIYQNLAATRKDRIEELRGGKESFFSLIATLQSSENERNKHGKYAELTKIASQDALNYFRQPVEFPDSKLDPVIIDVDTYTQENN